MPRCAAPPCWPSWAADDARAILERGATSSPLADRFLMAEGEILLEAGLRPGAATYGEPQDNPDDIDLLYSRCLCTSA